MTGAGTAPGSGATPRDQGQVAHRIVWQVVDGGADLHERLLRNFSNVLDELEAEGVQIEVVAHGAGLSLVLSNGGNAAALADLQKRGAVFVACENTMRRMDLTAADLVDGVTTVKAGIAEVVRRQSDGWNYLRA